MYGVSFCVEEQVVAEEIAKQKMERRKPYRKINQCWNLFSAFCVVAVTLQGDPGT
jgi:hypothetical protein